MKKEENYQNSIKSTKSVIKIYEKLKELEKNNNMGSEYQCWFSLLCDSINYEERYYQQEMVVLAKLSKSSINKKFINFKESLSILCDIRALNKVSRNVVYALEGNSFKEYKDKKQTEPQEIPVKAFYEYSPIDISVKPKSDIESQELIDEVFYKGIVYALKNEELKESEREILIETKYALLATSKTLEKKFINGDLGYLLPLNLSEYDKDSFTLNLVSKMHALEERILEIDDQMYDQENSIALLLYMYTLVKNMHGLYSGVIPYEFVNATHLNRILGVITGKTRNRICDLINNVFVNNYLYPKKKQRI